MRALQFKPSPDRLPTAPGVRFHGRSRTGPSGLGRVRAWAPDLALVLAVVVAIALAG